MNLSFLSPKKIDHFERWSKKFYKRGGVQKKGVWEILFGKISKQFNNKKNVNIFPKFDITKILLHWIFEWILIFIVYQASQ